MRLPGTIEERLEVILKERRWLLKETDIAELEDDGIRVDCSLAGVTTCIKLRLEPNDIQFLRRKRCADFALLLARGGDAFEAHAGGPPEEPAPSMPDGRLRARSPPPRPGSPATPYIGGSPGTRTSQR